MLNRVSALLLVIICFCPLAALAQFSSSNQQAVVEFRVYVSFGSRSGTTNVGGMAGVDSQVRQAGSADHPLGETTRMQIRVRVHADSGSVVGEDSPNAEGYVTFRVVGSVVINNQRVYPEYRVHIFGPEIEDSWAESVQPGLTDRVLNVTVYRKGDVPTAKSKNAMVSASGLAIPSKAQKELDKGNSDLSNDKLDTAKQHFLKAIEIYPQFDQAFNNLAVVYMKSGDRAAAKEALGKAIAINDKSARAYVNLGRIATTDKQFDEALNDFNKALSVEPRNTEALTGVCQAGVMALKYDQVVTAAKSIHEVPHDNIPICHFAAGIAYRSMNKPVEALAEYNLYLKEASSSDALVAKARQAVSELSKSAAQK